MITGFLLILSLHNVGMPKNVDTLYDEGVYTTLQQCLDSAQDYSKDGFFGDNVVSWECQKINYKEDVE